MNTRPRVVVVGGGFGGLHAVQSLKRAQVDITLIDRRNFHLFQPLLYQVATGGLSPANIATPLRDTLDRQDNARVLLGSVSDVDAETRMVVVDGKSIPYDFLILSTGSQTSYFGHSQWADVAPGLKTIEDATLIRARILAAFEVAESASRDMDDASKLTFVIIGAGPTGVELAGAVAELAKDTLQNEFRRVRPENTRIVLVEASTRVLPTYPERASRLAERKLRRLGVKVRTSCRVRDVSPQRVTVECHGVAETIGSSATLWAAGTRAASLGKQIAARFGVALDAAGRVQVRSDLSVPGYPDLFVIGDMAHCADKYGRPLPPVAPVALQQGKYVGRLIRMRTHGREIGPFRYKERGELATIGRSAAVAVFGRVVVNGLGAWILWLLVHLMQLVRHENRMLVFTQWVFNYVTRNRSARLITGSWANRSHTPSEPGPQDELRS